MSKSFSGLGGSSHCTLTYLDKYSMWQASPTFQGVLRPVIDQLAPWPVMCPFSTPAHSFQDWSISSPQWKCYFHEAGWWTQESASRSSSHHHWHPGTNPVFHLRASKSGSTHFTFVASGTRTIRWKEHQGQLCLMQWQERSRRQKTNVVDVHSVVVCLEGCFPCFHAAIHHLVAPHLGFHFCDMIFQCSTRIHGLSLVFCTFLSFLSFY